MRKNIYLFLLAGLFTACGEDDLIRYSLEKDGLQFYTGEDSKLIPGDASDLDRIFNFATATYQERKKGDEREETYYYGDNLEAYTYEKIYMQIQGFPSPDERPYKLKTIKLEDEESDFVPEVIFEPYYSVAPEQVRDTIKFTIVRPKNERGEFMRGTYRFGITIDTEDNPFFQEGVTEQNVLEVTLKDIYEKPDDWDAREEWLGAFDEEKYAFMLTYSQRPFVRSNDYMWNKTDKYNQELVAYLKEHPEVATRFATEIPDMPKTVWWKGDVETNLLGAYSREKFDFIRSVMGEEELLENDKLVYWNLIFREKVAADAGYEFPVNQSRAGWWNNQALGEWAVDKQEFVTRTIFETCKLNNVPEDAWEYVPSVIRLNIDAYNTAHPGAPLGLSFPEDKLVPEWWEMRQELFGEFSSIKRDVIVKALFEYNRDTSWEPVKGIPQLKNPQLSNASFSASYMPNIKNAIAAYNKTHPDNVIELPIVLPAWWNLSFLGEYNEKKENLVKEVMSQYYGTPNQWTVWNQWNIIFRYEAKLRGDKDIVFPVLDASLIKPSYWDKYKYLGEYSESKLVFTWMTLLPKCYGSVDEYALRNGYWHPYTQEGVYKVLVEAYNANYTTFMNRYASSNPEPFEYPATFPGN